MNTLYPKDIRPAGELHALEAILLTLLGGARKAVLSAGTLATADSLTVDPGVGNDTVTLTSVLLGNLANPPKFVSAGGGVGDVAGVAVADGVITLTRPEADDLTAAEVAALINANADVRKLGVIATYGGTGEGTFDADQAEAPLAGGTDAVGQVLARNLRVSEFGGVYNPTAGSVTVQIWSRNLLDQGGLNAGVYPISVQVASGDTLYLPGIDAMVSDDDGLVAILPTKQ